MNLLGIILIYISNPKQISSAEKSNETSRTLASSEKQMSRRFEAEISQ